VARSQLWRTGVTSVLSGESLSSPKWVRSFSEAGRDYSAKNEVHQFRLAPGIRFLENSFEVSPSDILFTFLP
jgi:hypothetical protein